MGGQWGDRNRDRKTDRQTDREKDGEKDRQTDRQTESVDREHQQAIPRANRKKRKEIEETETEKSHLKKAQ